MPTKDIKKVKKELEECQKDLKQAKNKFKEFTEGALEGKVVMDFKGKIIFGNKRATEIFGIKSAKEAIGKNALSFLASSEKKRATRNLMKVYRGKEEFVEEYRAETKKGEKIWIEVLAHEIEYEGKRAVLKTIRDITEKKKVKEKLEENEELLDSFINSNPDFIFLKDEKLRYIMVNKAYEDFVGKKKKEIIGKTDFELLPKKLAEQCKKSDKKVLKSEKTEKFEEFYKDKIFRTIKFPVKLGKGKLGVGGIISDVTERKKAEESLKKISRLNQKIIDKAPMGVFIINKQGVVEYANKAFAEISGSSLKKLEGINVFKLPTYKRLGLDKKIREAIKNKKEFETDIIKYTSYYGKKTTYRIFSGIPIFDKKGDLDKFLLTIEDVTELKEAEQEIKKSKDIFEDLYETTTIVAETDEVLDKICKKAHELFGGFFVLVNYAKGGKFNFRAGCKLPKEVVKAGEEPIKGAICSHLLRHDKEFLFSNNLKKDKCPVCGQRFSKDPAVELFGLKTYIGVPLIFSDKKSHGTLCITYKEKKERPGEKEIKILHLLAKRAAVELEREEKREKLEERETKYKKVLDNTRDIVLVAQKGKIKFANKAAGKITGYPLDDILGEPFTKFIHPQDKKLVAERHKKRLKGKKAPELYSFRIVTKKGKARWLEINAVKIKWNGEPATLNFLRDIKKRKEYEEKLEKSEKIFRIASQVSSDIVWDRDFSKGTLNWFGDIDRLLGYAKGKFPRTIEAWKNIIHPEDKDRVLKKLNDHIKNKEPYEVRYRVLDKNGNIMHWLDSGRALYGEKGNAYRMIGAISDITEEKKAEEELEKAYKNLKEKTKDLERFNKLAVGRENKMIELKNEIKELKEELREYKNK